MLLGVFYLIIDTLGYKKWTYFFVVIGLNSITIYLVQHKFIDFNKVRKFVFGALIHVTPVSIQPLVSAVLYVFCVWLFLFFLYKNKIFLNLPNMDVIYLYSTMYPSNMKRLSIVLIFVCFVAATAGAQQTDNVKIPCHYTDYYLSTGDTVASLESDSARGMTALSLRVYLPEKEKATGRMVIALPGGGYQHLAVFHEGFDWAPYFLDKGIAYGVLKYRMPAADPDIPFADVKAAFGLVRQHASAWHIDPEDIGIMGSSAGGHLASTYATHATRDEGPSFQILLYPVITMDASYTHGGSRKNLLGEQPSPEQTAGYSNESQVNKETPGFYYLRGRR